MATSQVSGNVTSSTAITPPPSAVPPSSQPSPPDSTISPSSHSSLSSSIPPGAKAGLVAGTVLGGLIVLIPAIIFFIWYRKRKIKEVVNLGQGNLIPEKAYAKPEDALPDTQRPHWMFSSSSTSLPGNSSVGADKAHHSHTPSVGSEFLERSFTFEELTKATEGFSKSYLLGQGGFGFVHMGVLSDGRKVAVKRLKSGSGQGDREFSAEIDIISRVQHPHLVSLVGYCIDGDQRILVYEFVPNNSLEYHLHGEGNPIVDWSVRMKIAVGAAKGLTYLHENCHPKIIHRDIKSSNILLDDKFEAKVADFGLARYSQDTETHVSTRVIGTFGYMAPEYASTGKLTEKSDVFSFGVVLLELITGHRPIDKNLNFLDGSIVDWSRPLLKQALEDGNYEALADAKLMNSYDFNEMTRMIACAAACVHHLARMRPKMSQIVQALEGVIPLNELNEGVLPGCGVTYDPHGGMLPGSAHYKKEMEKFWVVAMDDSEDSAVKQSKNNVR